MRNVKIVILGLVVALGFSGCSLFMGGEQKQVEVKNYCPLPSGVLERYEKIAKLIKAEIKQESENGENFYGGYYECRNCNDGYGGYAYNGNNYSIIVAKIISPNNKIDLSTTTPNKFRIYENDDDYNDAYSFNEYYNDEDYRKYTTCDERLAAYNQALNWYQKNQPNNRSIDSFIDRQINRNDPAKALEAESSVFSKFQKLVGETLKSKGINFR